MEEEEKEPLKVYVPICEHGTRGFYQIETENAVYHKTPGYDGFIIFYGVVLSGENLFTQPDGVQAYFNRSWNDQQKYRITADKLKWRF